MNDSDEEFEAVVKLQFGDIDLAFRYNPQVEDNRTSVGQAIDVLNNLLGTFMTGEYMDTAGNAYALTPKAPKRPNVNYVGTA